MKKRYYKEFLPLKKVLTKQQRMVLILGIIDDTEFCDRLLKFIKESIN